MMLNELKKYIAKSRFAPLFIETNKYGNIIPNINLDLTRRQKKVLLVYLDVIDASAQIASCYAKNESGAMHTNRSEFFQIIKCFINMDYCVDVCAHNDMKAIDYIKVNEYNIIIGLGEVFRWAVEHKRAYKILYLTENPYYISYSREMERLEYFSLRHQKKMYISRTGLFFQKDEEKRVDAVICLGEEKYVSERNNTVYKIFPTAFFNKKFELAKCVERKKNCFLVFGTDGFIHKGNDLLVEVFNKHPEWELYLCGVGITNIIKRDLRLKIKYNNIHDCGYINANSESFLKLINKCCFIVQPSCSEATSTAILTGMRHGLIPIVSHGNGFDSFREFCLFFEGFHLENIELGIENAMKLSYEEIRKKSMEICNFAEKNFTLQAYTENMMKIIKNLE